MLVLGVNGAEEMVKKLRRSLIFSRNCADSADFKGAKENQQNLQNQSEL